MLSASVLGDDAVTVQGFKVDSVVVRVQYKARVGAPGPQETSRTLWVDKERWVVVQERASIRGRVNSGFGDRVENVLEIGCRAERLNETVPLDAAEWWSDDTHR